MLPRIVAKPHLLIAEGKDDALWFSELVKHLRISDTVEVFGIGGKTKLRENLEALKRTPGFSEVISMGILRDADLDALGAFQSVCGTLKAIGLPSPDELLVPTRGRPHIGVMILPGDGRPGMLEDVILEAVQDDPVIPCADGFLECLRQPTITFPTNVSKARIQVFLAAKEPGKRLGESAHDGYWSYDHSAFAEVSGFIREIARID